MLRARVLHEKRVRLCSVGKFGTCVLFIPHSVFLLSNESTGILLRACEEDGTRYYGDLLHTATASL